jgi:hypothetical protein
VGPLRGALRRADGGLGRMNQRAPTREAATATFEKGWRRE